MYQIYGAQEPGKLIHFYKCIFYLLSFWIEKRKFHHIEKNICDIFQRNTKIYIFL